MNDKPDTPPGNRASLPASIPDQASVRIPGGVQTDFPDGSYLVDGPDGDRYLVSASGSISANVPCIRRVQIEDLSQVLSQRVAYAALRWRWRVSCLHQQNGSGMSLHGCRIQARTLPGGVIVVFGTWRADGG